MVVVVYDQLGVHSSPRGLYTFRSYGFDNVFVLNGGLPAWKHLGLPTTTTAAENNNSSSNSNSNNNNNNNNKAAGASSSSSSSSSSLWGGERVELAKRPGVQWTIADVRQNILTADGLRVQLLDARSGGRFLGTEPEPRVREGRR